MQDEYPLNERNDMNHGKHARRSLSEVVRSVPARWRGAAVAAAATGSLLGLAAAGTFSSASVNPNVTFTQNGVAGEYAAPTAAQASENNSQINGVHTTIYLRKKAEYNNTGGANLGVELCQFNHSGASAQLYTQFVPGVGFEFFDGFSASTPGGCLGGLNGAGTGVINGDNGTPLVIPQGHYVYLSATSWSDSGGFHVKFVVSDQTNQTGPVVDSSVVEAPPNTGVFDRAGVGTLADVNHLTTPANIKLAHFGSTDVRDQHGWTTLNGSTRTTANLVVDSPDSTISGALLIPLNLGSDSFNLDMGQLSN